MLENPLPKWLIHMASKLGLDVGKRPQFLSIWASLQDCHSVNCFHLEQGNQRVRKRLCAFNNLASEVSV